MITSIALVISLSGRVGVVSFASLCPLYNGRCTNIALMFFLSLHSINAS